MASFSHAQETSFLFEDFTGYIEQVHHVLRANHVPFGTPFDFLILAQTLENNSQLRNDLAVLLQSFMEGQEKISHHIALGIIAVASGGRDFTTSSTSMTQPAGNGDHPVNVLVDLLMSVGGRTQTSVQDAASYFESPRSEPNDGETHQTVPRPSSYSHEINHKQFPGAHSGDRSSPTDQDRIQNPNQAQDQDSLPQDSQPFSGTENPLVESLTRLELNALQVKHYLDSIDQRISRIEPRLDNLPTHVPYPTTSQPESGSEPGYGHVPDGRYSAMFATETLPHPPLDIPSPPDPSPTQTHPPTTIPSEMPSLLQISSRQKLSRKKVEIPIITGAALILLLLLYWGFTQNTQSAAIGPANPSPPQVTTIPQSDRAPAVSVSPSRTSGSVTARPSTSHIATAGSPPELHHRPVQNSTPALVHASSRSSATATPATAAATDELKDSPSLNPEPVNVSSGVMAANVLSDPQPSYPKLASLTHMRGEVVMQATISKDGTIENLHVIKGHRLLRGAAAHAVRAWRYRPFLVNGRPVEVATTVTVDFERPQ